MTIPGPVPDALCREQIDKIAASVTFARAEQLRDLLRWLSGRSVAAPGGSPCVAPSEKEIACHVLKRTDFDPRTDALVRKEMGRLREKLSRYYLSEGLKDPVLVNANNGYLMRFTHRSGQDTASAAACWLVLPFRARSELAEVGIELLEDLLVSLQERGGPQLISPAMALAYRERAGDLRQFAAECRASFVVEGSLRRRDQTLEAIVWLVDGQSGHTRRSRRISGSGAPEIAAETANWLLDADDDALCAAALSPAPR